MSSIYQKGRDGYFYYQTYSYNKKTGKNDKKVYHSLGTKDQKLALKMKDDLDLKYNSMKKKRDFFYQKNFNSWGIFLILISLLTISFIFFQKLVNHDTHDVASIDEVNIIPDQPMVNDTISSTDKENIGANQFHLEDKNINLLEVSTETKVDKISNDKLPEYTIHRIEKLSNAFNQGKIYITLLENDRTIIKSICNKIREDHSEFSNIIICVYQKNDIGINIANGISNIDEINEKVWLAMYTYNPVEGEYFDPNPSNYQSN